MEKSKILITGATGNIGTELTKLLVAQKIPFRAMVRDKNDTGDLGESETVEIVSGDFNDAQSIESALEKIERAFLLTNSSEKAETQQLDFVEAAKKAGVKQIVKLSQWAASADSPVRFLRYHAAVEQKIKDSEIAYTFLRPNLFMQGLLGFKDSIAKDGKFFASIGDAKISLVDVRDIAAVAATALTENGHEGKIYNLTGAEALSHYEMAEKLSKALDREIQFIDIPPDAMRETLIKFGFPEWQADGLIEDYAHYSRGEAAEIMTGIEHATGESPGTFDQFARDYASAFS